MHCTAVGLSLSTAWMLAYNCDMVVSTALYQLMKCCIASSCVRERSGEAASQASSPHFSCAIAPNGGCVARSGSETIASGARACFVVSSSARGAGKVTKGLNDKRPVDTSIEAGLCTPPLRSTGCSVFLPVLLAFAIFDKFRGFLCNYMSPGVLGPLHRVRVVGRLLRDG